MRLTGFLIIFVIFWSCKQQRTVPYEIKNTGSDPKTDKIVPSGDPEPTSQANNNTSTSLTAATLQQPISPVDLVSDPSEDKGEYLRQVVQGKICAGNIFCICPDQPLSGNLCSGGIVVKPKHAYPRTSYHIIAEKPLSEYEIYTADWKGASYYCTKNRTGKRNDWVLPACGVYGNWTPPGVGAQEMHRSNDFCELAYVVKMINKYLPSQSPGKHLPSVYWSRTSGGTLGDHDYFWAISIGDRQNRTNESTKQAVICVRYVE